MTHTPGPWECRFEKVRYVIYVTGDIGEKALATTGGAYPDSEANARLIAAAPCLLEALEAICSEFAQGHPLIVDARAAIARARGAA